MRQALSEPPPGAVVWTAQRERGRSPPPVPGSAPPGHATRLGPGGEVDAGAASRGSVGKEPQDAAG